MGRNPSGPTPTSKRLSGAAFARRPPAPPGGHRHPLAPAYHPTGNHARPRCHTSATASPLHPAPPPCEPAHSSRLARPAAPAKDSLRHSRAPARPPKRNPCASCRLRYVTFPAAVPLPLRAIQGGAMAADRCPRKHCTTPVSHKGCDVRANSGMVRLPCDSCSPPSWSSQGLQHHRTQHQDAARTPLPAMPRPTREERRQRRRSTQAEPAHTHERTRGHGRDRLLPLR